VEGTHSQYKSRVTHCIQAMDNRRQSLPVIYVRGTHYDVGFDVGRTFGSIIHSFLSIYKPLNGVYIPLYEKPEGKEVYEAALTAVKKHFPQYIRELEGIADGAKVPFYKLFLCHLDEILPSVVGSYETGNNTNGCSTICCNESGHEIIGHTEDALAEVLNHTYIVDAEINDGDSHETFTSFCYAGMLPGYAMGFNHHGLVFSINILGAKELVKGKIPRHFLGRALLGVDTFVKVLETLKNKGCGAADAMSVNLTFLNQEGDRLFHNIEMGPAIPPSEESPLSVLTISPGEHTFHCNRFLRLQVPEADGLLKESSVRREECKQKLCEPKSIDNVITILGNDSDAKFNIYRDSNDEMVATVAVGVFDCINRTWSLYTDNPKTSKPLIVLPITTK